MPQNDPAMKVSEEDAPLAPECMVLQGVGSVAGQGLLFKGRAPSKVSGAAARNQIKQELKMLRW